MSFGYTEIPPDEVLESEAATADDYAESRLGFDNYDLLEHDLAEGEEVGIPGDEEDSTSAIDVSDEDVYAALNSVPANQRRTSDQIIELAKRLERGDPRALEEMVAANQGLIHVLAEKYSHKGVEFDDLLQEGQIGLLRAIDGFDWRKGFTFSTYAIHAIAGEMIRCLNKHSHTIRKPVSITKRLRHIKEVEQGLLQKLGREPTIDEISQATGYEAGDIVEAKNSVEAKVSLNTRVGWEDGIELIDLQASDQEEATARLEAMEQSRELESLFSILTPRQRLVMERLRDSKKEVTVRQIADELGVTDKRIYQLRDSSITKIGNFIAAREAGLQKTEAPIVHPWQKKVDEMELEEIEALDLFARGFSNARIATEIARSTPDVKKILRSIAERFGIEDQDLLRYAPGILKLAGEVVEE